MFGFLEFVRVIGIGFISLSIFSVAFCKDLLRADAAWLIVLATVLGLMIQPFLRAHHPYRGLVHQVIQHVEAFIKEIGDAPAGADPSEKSFEGENALARAIYEHCIRSAEP